MKPYKNLRTKSYNESLVSLIKMGKFDDIRVNYISSIMGKFDDVRVDMVRLAA